MFGSRLLPTGNGSRHRLVLRDAGNCPQARIQEFRGEAAAEVESRLRRYLRGLGHLSREHFAQIERRQIFGDASGLPELVSYSHRGVHVLTVWTHMERRHLVVDFDATGALVRVAEGRTRSISQGA